MLTWDKGNGQEFLNPKRVDEESRSSDRLAVDLVLVACCPDPVDVVDDPLRLEGAGDDPDIFLLWLAATFIESPRVWHVLIEVGVLHSLIPNLSARELRPSWVLDLDSPGLEEDLLLAAGHLLEEEERSVLAGWQKHALIEMLEDLDRLTLSLNM